MSKKLIFKNDANTTIAAPVTTTATTIQVTNANAFPDPTTEGYYYLAAQSLSTGLTEYLQVTGKSGALISVVRGVDNSIALEFATGDYIGMRVIAAQFYDIITRITAPDNITVQSPGATFIPDLSKSLTIDLYDIDGPLTIANPVGTPLNFARLTFRLKSNGTAQTLAFGSEYVNSYSYMPSIIPAGNSIIIMFSYNSRLSEWECVGDVIGNIVIDAYSNIITSGNITCNNLYPNTALGIAYGGTAGTTREEGLNNLLPSQTANNNKFLLTNGVDASWHGLSITFDGAGTGATPGTTFDGLTALNISYNTVGADVSGAAASALVTAEGYTDTKVGLALTAANGYTDTQVGNAIISANGYTDIKVAGVEGNSIAFSVALG